MGLFKKGFQPKKFNFKLTTPPIFKGEERYYNNKFVILKEGKDRWLITDREQENKIIYQGKIKDNTEGEQILKKLDML